MQQLDNDKTNKNRIDTPLNGGKRKGTTREYHITPNPIDGTPVRWARQPPQKRKVRYGPTNKARTRDGPQTAVATSCAMTNNSSSLQGVGKMEGNKQASKQTRTQDTTDQSTRNQRSGRPTSTSYDAQPSNTHTHTQVMRTAKARRRRRHTKNRRRSHRPTPLTPAGGRTGGRQPHHTPHHIRKCTAQHETAFRAATTTTPYRHVTHSRR